jgi:CRP/FNR family transcriptional regulator, nitrogen oxide reductase regulator
MKDYHAQVDSLQRTSLFCGLSKNACHAILDNTKSHNIKSKELLFHQGHDASNTYFVIEGRLKLLQVNELGEEIILHYVAKHELAAAVSCISSLKYPASAKVIQPGIVLSWSREDLRQLMLDHPLLALNTFDIVQARFGDMQNRFMDLSTKRVEQRLARTLVRLVDRGGKKVANGILIDFPLTRQDIAEHAGTTLFSASRILSNWEKKQLIHSNHKKIVIADLHSLVALSEDIK